MELIEKKYELVDTGNLYVEKMRIYRVRALRDFGDVKKGDLGGFVQSEKNLSHRGNCWIYDDAIVCDNSFVGGNGKVKGTSKLHTNSAVIENAVVSDRVVMWKNSVVRGNAKVSGGVWLSEKVVVDGDMILIGEATYRHNEDFAPQPYKNETSLTKTSQKTVENDIARFKKAKAKRKLASREIKEQNKEQNSMVSQLIGFVDGQAFFNL